MHPKFHARRILWGIVAVCLMVGGATVQAQTNDRGGTVVVPVGGAVRLQMKSKKVLKQVFNEKPNVVFVETEFANPAALILRGMSPGTSRLELTDADNGKEIYEVVVQTDFDLLRNILKRAVPTANVDVIPFGTGVVLSGSVARAEDVDTVMRVATTILGAGPGGPGAPPGPGGPGGGGLGAQGALNIVNAMTVGGVQQVQLDVTVARVDRTRAKQRGFNIIVGGTTVSAGSILGGLTSSSGSSTSSASAAGVGIIPSAASAVPSSTPNLIAGVVPAQLQLLLQALKTENLAKLIAEPKLVTQSGRPARFLSGGQQATVGPATGVSGGGVVYQEIGTELEFLPIVYGNGKIYLEVAPRVRGVNSGLGLAATSSQPAVPGFDEQSVRTSIVLESGQTFAIGGLIQTNVQASASKVPVLGELPFLGAFFSSVSQTEQEQELVILVTPHLVDPMDCNQIPKRLPGTETRAADDFEIYLESMLEAPRGQRNVFDGRKYRAAWKSDPTASAFPCGASGYGYGYGAGNCSTCAPTSKGSAMIDPAMPGQLPPAVSSPTDIPGKPRGR